MHSPDFNMVEQASACERASIKRGGGGCELGNAARPNALCAGGHADSLSSLPGSTTMAAGRAVSSDAPQSGDAA